MKRSILFLLPGFNFGGTVFSTLNMISYLRKDYDIKVLPMVSVGPVREYYDTAILLPPVKSIEAIQIHKEDIYAHRCLYVFYKVLNHCCIALHIPLSTILYKRAAQRLMLKYNFDFVASCQEGDSTVFLSHFKKVKKIAWYRIEHSVFRNNHSLKMEDEMKRYYPEMDKIVCVSKTTRDDFAYWFPEVASKAFAVHNIQNVENIRSKASERVEDPLDREIFTIVSVGRFSRQKQFSKIPSIARHLKADGCKFKWYIIGDGNADSEYDKFLLAQKENETEDCVLAIGGRKNPYPYIASANLFVITSYFEACPRVVAEAQILGTPVVSTDYRSATEFVNDKTHGIVGTIDTLPKIIARYIKDISYYNEIKTECAAYNSENEIIYKQLLDIFS